MRKLTLMIMTIMVFAASAFAATSSPCGYKQPPAPSQPRDEGYRRDVLDFKVPVQTENKPTWDREQATKDRETLISGQQ